MATIGIRRETKSIWERRVAITPALAKNLVASGTRVLVERSDRRVFTDAEYTAAGAELVDELPAVDLMIGVKEIPAELYREGGAYLMFAHVIKGQPYNMPMLQTLLDKGCTLLDYERIVDSEGRRQVFFGKHAGLAGMIDSLWALGQRSEHEGIDSPFSLVKMAHDYGSLAEALGAISFVGQRIEKHGVPEALHPLIVGVAGAGNVASGVQRILSQLPTKEVAPEQLPALLADEDAPRNVVYVTTFREHDMARKIDGGDFVLQEYYDHPDRFEGTFEQHLPHLSMLMNCIYWTDAYPRLVTKQNIGTMARCKVIGDISCDIEGSIEVTLKATEPGDPVYTYDAKANAAVMGIEGEGPVICAVDILPAELPREASETFSEALQPYVSALAACDWSADFEALELPEPMKRSVIAHQGKLVAEYAYIGEWL